MFLGGKGGVGKTTHAAMAALYSSSSGRTLLVTTDPASSLSAVLDVPVGSLPGPVPGAKGLDVANVDAKRAFQQWLAPRRDVLQTIAVRGTYLDEEDVGRLLKLSLPGIDEVIGLLEVVRMARAADMPYEHVVVDTAPTGHTLRLLAAPVLLGRVAGLLNVLHAHHRAVVSALRGSYRTDAADSLILELDREGEELGALLRDTRVSTIAWVTLPEPMALEETSDAITALDAAGLHVARLIVNRMTVPPPGPCAWCDARRRFEARALTPLASRFRGREIVAFPELAHEPRGVPALRAAAKSLGPWQPPARAEPVERRVRGALRPKGRSSLTLDFDRTRLLLFGGKGGVGKSTCAAATAIHLAESGRVLLLSSDPAHSLGDVLGARFDNQPRPVPGAPDTLHAREIDAAAEMDRFRRKYVEAVDDAFARIARTAGGDQAAFRELIDLAPPGIDEVIAVADVAETITEGKGAYDVVVVDTAPTGHALRLLQTPAVLRDWTLALMAILLKYREIVGAGMLATLLVQLSKRLRGLQDILADPAQCRFVVVTRAARVPAAESLELIEALASMRMTVDAVIVNATGAGDCTRCRAVARAHTSAIDELRRGLGERAYAIIEAPAEIPPPHGPRALREWARAWHPVS